MKEEEISFNEKEEEKHVRWTSVIAAPEMRKQVLDLNFLCPMTEMKT